jgi:hypothetical protein
MATSGQELGRRPCSLGASDQQVLNDSFVGVPVAQEAPG